MKSVSINTYKKIHPVDYYISWTDKLEKQLTNQKMPVPKDKWNNNVTSKTSCKLMQAHEIIVKLNWLTKVKVLEDRATKINCQLTAFTEEIM